MSNDPNPFPFPDEELPGPPDDVIPPPPPPPPPPPGMFPSYVGDFGYGPPKRKRGEYGDTLPFYLVWLRAVTQPSEPTYHDLLADPWRRPIGRISGCSSYPQS